MQIASKIPPCLWFDHSAEGGGISRPNASRRHASHS